MKQVPIDRKRRLTLLKWLKAGAMDWWEYQCLVTQDERLTKDEWEQILDELTEMDGFQVCERCQRLGVCELNNDKKV